MEELFGGGDPLDGFVEGEDDPGDPKIDMIQSHFANGGQDQDQQGQDEHEQADDDTASPTTNYVTLVMFEKVRKQLEEKHEEEVTSLKSSFDFHMEERRENEKILKTCIETLMTEVVRLEERIEELDKRVKAQVKVPPPPEKKPQLAKSKPQPQQLQQNRNWGDSDIKINDGHPKPGDLLQVKMEDVEGTHFEHSNYPTDPLSTPLPQPSSSSFLPEDSDPNDLYMIEGHEEEHPPQATVDPLGSSVVAPHGRADGVGNFLPFLCHCGLEFDSEQFLSDHILEEEQEAQMNKEGDDDEEEANFDPAQLLHHTDWATPQIISIQPSSTSTTTAAPRKPRIRNRARGGIRMRDAQHGYDPHRPLFCLCRRWFPTDRKLYRHVEYFTKERDFACTLCGKVFAYASILKSHVEKSHNLVLNKGTRSPAPSSAPKAGTGTYPVLKKALAPAPNTNNLGGSNRIIIKATTSGYQVSQPQSHHYPLPNQVPPQNVRSSRGTPGTKPWQHKYKGKSHGYHPYLPLHCLCGLQCRDRGTLLKHVNYFTELKKKAIPCKICGQKYPYASQLNAHIARAHGRKTVTSNANNGHEQEASASSSSTSVKSGGKLSAPGQHHPRFPNQHGVGREGVDEEGKPQYFCKCGRSYVSKGVLNFHIRMATSGKLLHCHLCPEGSRQYSLVALKYHMKTKHNLD